MRKVGHFEFPESAEEVNAWTPFVARHALARRVLAVMKTRIEGTWAAYIDAVPGKSHEEEQNDVLAYGNKLSEPMARLLFPDVPKELTYAP